GPADGRAVTVGNHAAGGGASGSAGDVGPAGGRVVPVANGGTSPASGTDVDVDGASGGSARRCMVTFGDDAVGPEDSPAASGSEEVGASGGSTTRCIVIFGTTAVVVVSEPRRSVVAP